MSQQSSSTVGSTVSDRGPTGIAPAGVALVALIVIQSGLGQSVLRDAGVIATDRALRRDLYLPNARALPSKVPASDRFAITFALDNLDQQLTHLRGKCLSKRAGRRSG